MPARSRERLTPHYCIHGTNRWTDYDNICGPCEDGYTDRELALDWAHRDVRQWIERFHDVTTLQMSARHRGERLPQMLTNQLWAWANEPLAILDLHHPDNAARPRRNLP